MHGRAITDHPFVTEFLVQSSAELGIVAQQSDSAGCLFHCVPQFGNIERLRQIRMDAMLPGSDSSFD